MQHIVICCQKCQTVCIFSQVVHHGITLSGFELQVLHCNFYLSLQLESGCSAGRKAHYYIQVQVLLGIYFSISPDKQI